MKLSGHKGQTINSQPLAGFLLTEIAYASRIDISQHSHQQACFCFVLEGSYTELYQHKVIECQPSHLIYRPAGEVHSDHIGEANVRCFCIEFETKWLEGFRRKSIKLNEPAIYQSNSLFWLAMKLRKESQEVDDFTSIMVEGLMLEIIAEMGRKTVKSTEVKQPRWLIQAREILHANVPERMSLSEIAESVAVHPVYLAEMFKHHYKCTIGEYIRRLRVEFASRELSHTAAPLVEIALAAGFAHQSHFPRTFKRLTGLTPAQYRLATRSP
jgi:AraC family transcriptional regulator